MDENQTMDHDRIMYAMVSSLCTAVFFTVCSVLETPVTNLIRNVRAW